MSDLKEKIEEMALETHKLRVIDLGKFYKEVENNLRYIKARCYLENKDIEHHYNLYTETLEKLKEKAELN